MPLKSTAAAQCDECWGHSWLISNEDRLASLVAKLLLGQYAMVQKLIASRAYSKQPNPTNERAVAAIKRRLRVPKKLKTLRDGWLFQMISWIAARNSAAAGSIFAPPHTQPAEKGIDTFYIEFGQDSVASATIGEDKATVNPRRTVQSEVWPSFQAYRDGERDHELVSLTTLLLQHRHNSQRLVEAIQWKRALRYRIAITTKSADTAKSRRAIFKGFKSLIGSDQSYRRGDTFNIASLRKWFDHFSKLVCDELDRAPHNNV